MKKFLCLFLTIVMLLSCIAVVGVTADTVAPDENAEPGSEAYTAWLESQGYVAIGSFEELNEKIRNITFDTNADKDQKAAVLAGKYYLTADITVTDVEKAMTEGLTGVFDGNGHTIYNTYKWVFDELSGTVKNVYLSAYKDATETDVFTTVDPVCGYDLHDGAKLENVVTDRTFNDVANYWGSFARSVDSGATVSFVDCVNNSSFGNFYPQNNMKVAGFVSRICAGATVTFTRCVNNGNIYGSQAGGFVSYFEENGGQNVTFKDCVNTGLIEGIIGVGGDGAAKAYGISGGFIGGVNNANDLKGNITITLDGCVNIGNVVRTNKYNKPTTKSTPIASGGLIGQLGKSTDDYAVTLTITDCVISGCTIGGDVTWSAAFVDPEAEEKEVKPEYIQGYAGAIVGWLGNKKNAGNITIEDVYVSNVTVKAGDPATASALINTASDTNVVAMKNVFVVGSTYTSVATGAYSIQNDAGTDTNLTVQKAQASTPVEGALKVRFLGGLDNLNYYNVGYMVEKTCDGKTEYFFLETKTVYEAVNNGAAQLTKADFGDRYIVAIPLADLADNKTVEFKVTPYAVSDEDGLLIGATKSVTLTNGVLS